MKDEVKAVTIELENGTKYTLDYDRETAETAEENGLDISTIKSRPIGTVRKLFHYAFLKNHPKVTKQQTDDMIDEYFGGVAKFPPKLIERLALLYMQTVETLNDEKNLKKATITY